MLYFISFPLVEMVPVIEQIEYERRRSLDEKDACGTYCS